MPATPTAYYGWYWYTAERSFFILNDALKDMLIDVVRERKKERKRGKGKKRGVERWACVFTFLCVRVCVGNLIRCPVALYSIKAREAISLFSIIFLLSLFSLSHSHSLISYFIPSHT